MAQKLKIKTSELFQRRGIELQPLITNLPDEMPPQLVSRYKSGMYGTHRHPLLGGAEVSNWSSSSSSSSLEITVRAGEGARNEKNDAGTSTACEDTYSRNDNNEPEPDFDFKETYEERLERWCKFYSERPLKWYMNKDDYDEFLDDMLFDRLYNEVQYTVFDIGPSKHRGQENIRIFWDDIRKQLRDEESLVLDWPPTQEQQHCIDKSFEIRFDEKRQSRLLPPRALPPTENRTADGKDPELVELRELLMEKARQKTVESPQPVEISR